MADVLLVLDRSPSMSAYLDEVIANLQGIETDVASLHIAVITSDLAAYVPGCEGGGDGEAIAPAADCPGSAAGPVIIDEILADGSIRKNFPASISEALSCILPTTASTCVIEQPLEALRRALARGVAPGFRRPTAPLLIGFITDEDDCSLYPNALLDPIPTGRDLETWSHDTCFRWGVDCDQSSYEGVMTGCEPTDYPEVGLDPVIAAVDALDAPQVIVTVTGGEPIVFAQNTLVSVCGNNHDAWPAPRLAAFAATAADVVHKRSACSSAAGAEPVYEQLLPPFDVHLASPCVLAEIDVDSTTAGVQAHCVGELRDGATTTVLPDCAEADAPPCWQLVEDQANCFDAPDALAVGIVFGPTEPLREGTVTIDCELACPL